MEKTLRHNRVYRWLGMAALCVVGLMSAQFLSACSSDPAAQNSDAEKEITFMIPDWGVPSDEMLAEFKEETGITVHVQTVGWDEIKQKVSVASAGKNAAADVFEVDWSWVGEFKNAGWLEKLDIPAEAVSDIPSLAYFKVDGDYYAVPWANDMRLAYLNTHMMTEAGLNTTPDNWNDLLPALGKLKETGVSEYPLLYPLSAEEKTTTSFMTLAYTRNNIVFNDDGTLNRESALDALTLIEDMIAKGYISPATPSTPGIDVFKGIRNGDGAFLEGPSFLVTSVNDEKTSKVVGQVQAIPFPGKDGLAEKSIAFTEAIGISPFSQNKEAAKEFVAWYYKPETQKKLNRAADAMPTRTSVLKDMIASGDIVAPEFVIAQSEQVASPFPLGVPKYYAQMSTEIFNIINQLGQGKLTAAEACDQMVAKVDALVAENK